MVVAVNTARAAIMVGAVLGVEGLFANLNV